MTLVPDYRFSPEVAFRGSRNYVHSTDLYDALLRGASSCATIVTSALDFRIKKTITCRPVIEYYRGAISAIESSASLTFKSGDTLCSAFVTETHDPITSRRPYDEKPVATYSKISGREAFLDGQTGMYPIEALTALAVHLHKTVLSPPPLKKWMLGSLTIRRALQDKDAEMLTLTIDKLIGGTMTRTQIIAHDGNLGTLLFMLAPEAQ